MSSAKELTAGDWIAVGLNALLAVALLSFPFVVGRAFAEMYAEFGSALPAMTRIGLMPWPGMGLGLGVAALTGLAVAPNGPDGIGIRRALLVGAFFGGVFALAGLLYTMYAPMFDLAGRVRVE